MADQTYDVGDTFMKKGKLYRVTKIKESKNKDGETEQVMLYERVFKKKNASPIVCQLPVKNIDKVEIRPVSTKKDLMAVLKNAKAALEDNPATEKRHRISKKDRQGNENDLEKTEELLIKLQREKQYEDKKFALTKKFMLRNIKRSLAEEIAHVWDISLEKAEEKVSRYVKTA